MTNSSHDSNAMAVSATLHCLTGCATGEILGLIIGSALSLTNLATIIISTGLAFIFGLGLSTLPLIKIGASFREALPVVLAADLVSITSMEIVDNLVMLSIPNAMDATLVDPLLWASMMLALTVAFFAALPVNKYLLTRGKGHALSMNLAGKYGHKH